MHLQSAATGGNPSNDMDPAGGGGDGRPSTTNEKVHMYREMSSGALNRATYNKMTPIQNEDDMMMTSSDMDEPMPGSQSIDSEAPLTHNSSKSNFFPVSTPSNGGGDNDNSQQPPSIQSMQQQPSSLRGNQGNQISGGAGGGIQVRDSPMGHSKYNPQYAKGSPHNLPR